MHIINQKGGGESFDQLCDRSMNALEQIAKKHKGIITHDIVFSSIRCTKLIKWLKYNIITFVYLKIVNKWN